MAGGVDPNAKGPDGLPIIFTLIEQENIAAIEAVLKAGADIEAQGFAKATPVLKAAFIDLWPIVAMLIQHGANVRAADYRGLTLPWMTAHAQVGQETAAYASLNAVRKYLNDRGLLERIYEPAEVRELLKQGKWQFS